MKKLRTFKKSYSFSLYFILILLFFQSQALARSCYISVEDSGNFKPTVVTKFAIPLISQHFEPVSLIPPGGIGANECLYVITLTESRDGTSISIIGRKLNAVGESLEPGVKGVRQAILRAIYRAKPSKKKEFCNVYRNILVDDCSPGGQRRIARPVIPTPPPLPGISGNLGYLQVNINTPSASIYINGISKGQASSSTPLNIKGLRTGSLTVTAESAGYNKKTKTVRIQSNKWTQILFVLDAEVPQSVGFSAEFSNIATYRGSATLNGVFSGSGPRSLKTIKWQKSLRGTPAAPVIAGDTIFIAQDDELVSAMNIQTGAWVWEFRPDSDVELPPVVVNDIVLIADKGDEIYALDRLTGRKIWNSNSDKGPEYPISADESVVIIVDEDEKIFGYNLQTGREQWELSAKSEIKQAPAIMDGIFYLSDGEKRLLAREMQTGRTLWIYDAADKIISSVAIEGDKLFFHNNDEEVVVLDRATGALKWKYEPKDGSLKTDLLVMNNIVYFATDGPSVLYAMDGTSKQTLWTKRLPTDLLFGPVAAAGLIYLVCEENRIYILDSASGQIISEYQLNDEPTSAPVLADGTLFIGTEDKRFYALQ